MGDRRGGFGRRRRVFSGTSHKFSRDCSSKQPSTMVRNSPACVFCCPYLVIRAGASPQVRFVHCEIFMIDFTGKVYGTPSISYGQHIAVPVQLLHGTGRSMISRTFIFVVFRLVGYIDKWLFQDRRMYLRLPGFLCFPAPSPPTEIGTPCRCCSYDTMRKRRVM